MYMNYAKEKQELLVKFEEEIDHHRCLECAVKMDNALEKYSPKCVVFDFGKVDFMDSSGIGMLIGRYRKLLRNGGKAVIRHVCPSLQRILTMSGILKIMPMQKEETISEEERRKE